MIIGLVNAHREAIIPVVIYGPTGKRLEIEAVIDTGFSGAMSLPTSLITELSLRFRSRGRAILADGSESIFDIYEATVIWDGQSKRVAVDEANTDPLIGMNLLHNHELKVQVVTGGHVSIAPLPSHQRPT